MARLTFYGAARTVTGSRHLLELGGQKLLIDCGLFQGTKENRLKNWDPFPVPPADIDRVLLTHAHIDHTGYLPRFCRDGFKGPVQCTRATYDLAQILLRDSAYLQEEDAAWANKKGFSKHSPALPLYTIDDANEAIRRFDPVYFGDDIYLNDNVRIKFREAGHLLGGGLIDIKVKTNDGFKKILFSGDLGRSEELILREPVQAFNIDYLVLESTYGNRLHENATPDEELARVINESVDRGGVLLIPSFSVGRTQMLLYMIRELEEAGLIPDLPVYVDSPMAIDATDIFRQHVSDLNLTARIAKLQGKAVFHPRNINFCKSRDQSKNINNRRNRAVIISASGMATGGRILHHMVQRLPSEKNTMLFVGYQAEGTRGRIILEGRDTVKIHGSQVPVRAHVENISGFSGHADYNEILAWLMGFNKPPLKTFLVHGELEAAEALAGKIRERFGWDVVIPDFGDSFEFDLDPAA